MPKPHNENRTYTGQLSREINAAYEAYKAGAPDGSDRLLKAFVVQARNIARFQMRDKYDDTVAYDAAHRAMLALKDFDGKSPLSTWLIQIAKNEGFREIARLLRKRTKESSINVPEHPPDQSLALDVAKLRAGLPPEQAEVLDLMAAGYSLEKIAKKLGKPLGTIRSRYRLAKEKMNRKAENGGGEVI